MKWNPVRWIREKALRQNYSIFDLSNPQGRPLPSTRRELITWNRNWAYVCASRNAETIAGVPLRLYVKGGDAGYYGRRTLSEPQAKNLVAKGLMTDDAEEVIGNHPLLELLDRVNPEMTRPELVEATVNYQELLGDAYWYLEPGPLGMPLSIYPLMSQYVKIVRDGQAQLVGYMYGKDSTTATLLPADTVIHFKYPNPADPDYGLGCLEASLGAAALLRAEQEFMRNHYENGGIPRIGLSVKGKLSKDQRKELYEEWQARFASKRKGDQAIILEGDMDVKTFGFSLADSGIEFSQQFSREEVCAAFGVPLTMIQLNEASRAGAEAGDYAYMAHTIAPKLRRIEAKLNEQLAARYDPRLFLAFDDCVPENKDFRLKEIDVRLRTKMTTINEERAIEGMPPVEWGDEPVVTAPPVAPNQQDPDNPNNPNNPNVPEKPEDEPKPGKPKALKVWQPRMTRNERGLQTTVTEHFVRVAANMDEVISDAHH
jgi:HK97 family phage portal protein